MPELELYEKKVLNDEEYPVQMGICRKETPQVLFRSHWHEHLELHFVIDGEAEMELNHKHYHVSDGDLLIANSNELHSGFCKKTPYKSYVLIFDMSDLSEELAKSNFVFKSLVSGDPQVKQLFDRIFKEYYEMNLAYKQICRGLILELLVYLCRNHIVASLPERDSIKRKMNLERLNTVLFYIEKHFPEPISNAQLASMICLSEDRFGHLFREGVGRAPLQYINELRLKKAKKLLIGTDYSVTEVAEAVGFTDYNHFGRLFRKRYQCTPYEVKKGKIIFSDD